MIRVLFFSLVIALSLAPPAEAAPGTVSGTVIRTNGGLPIVGDLLWLCDASENCNGAYTDGAGAFTFSVDPGTYYLFTDNQIGMINEVYDNIQCPGTCSSELAVQLGTPIVVTSGGAVTGRNFSLLPGGTIAGVVSNAATLAAVPGASVSIYTRFQGSLRFAGAGFSAANGLYTVGKLPSGTYYAFISNVNALIPEIYNDVPCYGSCSASSAEALGTPITVTAGAITTSRNFALTPGGSITGTVRHSGTSAPLQNVTARLVTPAGSIVSDATDASGVYAFTRLPSGSYYLYTLNNAGFLDEYYDNVPCDGFCSSDPPPAATPVVVSSPAVASGRDFSLDPGGIITGTIVNAATSAPANGVFVTAYRITATGSVIAVEGAGSNASGVYTIGGLSNGTYYLGTSNSLGLANEVYDNLPCIGSCETTVPRGTGIAVAAGTTVAGKDFALQPGGTITGSLLSQSGSPIPNSYVYVYSRDEYGNAKWINAVAPASDGAYSVGGLGTGAYFVYTGSTNHLNEIFGGVACVGPCDQGTVLGAGTPVAVTVGAATAGINFSLKTAGRISGVVRNAATAAGLPNVWVYAYRYSGGRLKFGGQWLTDSAGAYTIGGLPSGDYYVYSGAEQFQNQIHSGVICPLWCDPGIAVAHGTPVPVSGAGTVGGLDFSLSAVGTERITGTVRNATTSAPLSNTWVYAYTRNGADYQYANAAPTNSGGTYQLFVPPGTYYLHTWNPAYLSEFHNDIPCLITCTGVGAVTRGAPVTVTTGAVTVDFALQPTTGGGLPGPPDELWGRVAGGTVRLEWYESIIPGAGEPTDHILEVGFSPGTTALSVPVTGYTFQVSGVPAGRYFLRVRGRNSSGTGPPSGEFELIVNADGSAVPGAPGSLSMFVEGGRLYASWAEPWNAGFATGYVIEAGTAAGSSNLATFPVGPRSYLDIPAPPPGVYFVRVRGRNALSVGKPSDEFMLVVGGAASAPGVPTSVQVAVDATRRVTVGWNAPRGPIAMYVLEAGTATGRYDIGAFPLPASPTSMTTAGPVPPGVYFLRLRAVNASGVGAATTERVLVVP